MAFNDKPQIDQSAVNSRESETALHAIFQEKNGFISRIDVPDKGCDFVIELIEGSGATNRRFQVQLKSIDQPSFIENGTYLAYSFETSRLGYLLRNKPTTGIIVFYSVPEKKLYYDFIVQVYHRVKDRQKSEAWKQQEKVTIHLPVANELTYQTAIKIHQTVNIWFKNMDMALMSIAENYNLPVVNTEEQKEIDFHNVENVVQKLKDYGLQLVQEFELGMVRGMLDLVPYATLLNDPKLTLLAATAYCEAAMYVDSDYFVQKLKRNPTINQDQMVSLDWIALRNDYNTGKIDNQDFVKKAEAQFKNVNDEINKLTIELNITYFKLSNLRALDEIPPFTLEQIQNNFQRIDQLNATAIQKDQFRIFNLENYSSWLSAKRVKLFGNYTLAKELGQHLTNTELREQDELLRVHFAILYNKISKLFTRSQQEDKKILMASSLLLRNRLLLSFEFDHLVGFPNTFRLFPNDKATSKKIIDGAIHAYNIFIETGYTKQAYDSLCNALEFLFLTINFYQQDVDLTYNMKDLLDGIVKLESELQIDHYQLQAELLVANQGMNGSRKSGLEKLSDLQLQQLAKRAQYAWALPDEQMPNILKELKDLQTFYQRYSGTNIELSRKYPFGNSNKKLIYSVPPVWQLVNKSSGIVSADSSNIDTLLTSWGL